MARLTVLWASGRRVETFVWLELLDVLIGWFHSVIRFLVAFYIDTSKAISSATGLLENHQVASVRNRGRNSDMPGRKKRDSKLLLR